MTALLRLACDECLALANDAHLGGMGIEVSLLNMDEAERTERLAVLAERVGHRVDPAIDVHRLHGLDAVRYLAGAAAALEEVRWQNGVLARPVVIASVSGRLVCEMHRMTAHALPPRRGGGY